MPDHGHHQFQGRIGAIFAHRFVIETETGPILADLGPKGVDAFTLTEGISVIVAGEKKPSELKVSRIARVGEALVAIEHKKPPHQEHAELRNATKAVEKAGLRPLGEPRRKPKHFEVLAHKGGNFVECHVEFDGHIRNEKPIDADDAKWSRELTLAGRSV